MRRPYAVAQPLVRGSDSAPAPANQRQPSPAGLMLRPSTGGTCSLPTEPMESSTCGPLPAATKAAPVQKETFCPPIAGCLHVACSGLCVARGFCAAAAPGICAAAPPVSSSSAAQRPTTMVIATGMVIWGRI